MFDMSVFFPDGTNAYIENVSEWQEDNGYLSLLNEEGNVVYRFARGQWRCFTVRYTNG